MLKLYVTVGYCQLPEQHLASRQGCQILLPGPKAAQQAAKSARPGRLSLNDNLRMWVVGVEPFGHI
jgi:hypothetical protein